MWCLYVARKGVFFFFGGVFCFCDLEKNLKSDAMCVTVHDSLSRTDPTHEKRFPFQEKGEKPLLQPLTEQFYKRPCVYCVAGREHGAA